MFPAHSREYNSERRKVMKKISGLWKLVALLLVCIMIGTTVIPHLVMQEDADARKKKDVAMTRQTSDEQDQTVGSEDNPYTIVEITPYHGLSQMIWLSGETMPDVDDKPERYYGMSGNKTYQGFTSTLASGLIDKAPLYYKTLGPKTVYVFGTKADEDENYRDALQHENKITYHEHTGKWSDRTGADDHTLISKDGTIKPAGYQLIDEMYLTDAHLITILDFMGYAGKTKYVNSGVLTDAGKALAVKFINQNLYANTQFDPDHTAVNTQIQYKVEKLENTEIFKRYIIGIEDRVLRDEYYTRYHEDYSYSATTTNRAVVEQRWAALKAEVAEEDSALRKKVFDECEDFHVRVIVATEDEVNKSVDNPNTVINTVGSFPEKVQSGVYQTYRNPQHESLIEMADMFFIIDRATNMDTVDFYHETTLDCNTSGRSVAKPSSALPNIRRAEADGHYKVDLSAKAAYKLLERMVNRTPIIINKARFEEYGINTNEGTECNMAKIMLLMLLFDFDTFQSKDVISRLSYDATAAVGSKAYFTLKYRDQSKWGEKIFGNDSGTIPKDDAEYPAIDKTDFYMHPPAIRNGSVFIYNSDENFNQAIVGKTYGNHNGTLDAATNYFTEQEIIHNGSTFTPAELLRTIAGFDSEINPLNDRPDLYILEVQPCADYEQDDVTGTDEEGNDLHEKALETFYRKFLPGYVGNIHITQVSSSELIGLTDDFLATYDFIYFGSLTGKMNTNAAGKTEYNDTSLNGKLYLHTGDVVKLNDGRSKRIRGSLMLMNDPDNAVYSGKASVSDAADVYRYSGNDITKRVCKELKDYVKAGHVVAFDKEYLTNGAAVGVNGELLDNTSNMYDFVRFCLGTEADGSYKYYEDVVFAYDHENATRIVGFESAVGREPMVTIEMLETPTEYTDSSKNDANKLGTASTNHALTFRFKLRSTDTSKKYRLHMYVDTHGDGSYDAIDEITPSLTNHRNLTAAPMNSESTDGAGVYSFTLHLNADYNGMVPWKLEVKQVADATGTENELMRDCATGYTAVRRTAEVGGVEEIKILEILSSRYKTGYNNDAGDDWDLSRNADFQTYASDTYMNRVGFSVKIDEVIRMNDLIDRSAGDKCLFKDFLADDGSYNGTVLTSENNPFLAKDANGEVIYDMLLYGFGDGCGFEKDTDLALQKLVLEAVKGYSDEGYAVLFSHDNMSIYQTNLSTTVESGAGDTYYAGYYANYAFREIMAADRYGVYLDSAMRDALGKDKPYKAGSATGDSPGDVITATEDAALKGATGINAADLHSNYQIQGFTNSLLDGFVSDGQKASIKRTTVDSFPIETNKVTQVNQGQITLFPYTVDEAFNKDASGQPLEFPVAMTHSQYYQLDMEREDVVVWYCLDGGNYSDAKNDVRNNYYIYNTGNITYTGMGHRSSVTTREVQLFINTMVAAYRAKQKRPYSVLTNDSATYAASSSDRQYLYLDFDAFDVQDASGNTSTTATIISEDVVEAADSPLNETSVRLVYRVIDNNLLINMKTYVTPVVWSHSTNGVVSRDIDNGSYSASGLMPYTTVAVNSKLELNAKELSADEGIELLVGKETNVFSNVYELNSNGTETLLPIVRVDYGKRAENNSIYAVKLDCSGDINDENGHDYVTYVPVRYFYEVNAEGNNVNQNYIYVSLSPFTIYGESTTERYNNIVFGDGNVVSISKRELFDLK